MSVLVELRGLELHGRHGALENERREGQRFLFDVQLELDLPGARTDALADTVDYRDVVDCVRSVSDGRAFTLLEALATAVADALLERFPLVRARVRVRKPEVVLEVPVEFAAATVDRRR